MCYGLFFMPLAYGEECAHRYAQKACMKGFLKTEVVF